MNAPNDKDNNFIFPAMPKEALDCLPFGVYVIGQDGIIEFFNAKMAEISGVDDPAKIVGQNVFKIPTYEQYGLARYMKRGLGGEPFKIEGIKYVSYLGKKESFRSYYGIPVKDENGEALKLLCICEDVTEKKNLENRVASDLAEKEILLKEINHRVKNNMQVVYSLLNLQSLDIRDEKALKLLEEIKGQIKSILLVHEKLYATKNISRIRVAEYIGELTDNIFKTFWVDTERVNKRIVIGPDLILPLDKAIPCALIVNELVTNAIKYAFPDKRRGEITVRFGETEKNRYELRVSDNGAGFAPKSGKRTKKTLGLELVKTLARQINGELKIMNDHGVKIIIKF